MIFKNNRRPHEILENQNKTFYIFCPFFVYSHSGVEKLHSFKITLPSILFVEPLHKVPFLGIVCTFLALKQATTANVSAIRVSF